MTQRRRSRGRTVGWYVTAAMLLATSAWPGDRGDEAATRDAELRAEAKVLRDQAQRLSERGELGEAIVLAMRADEIDPDEAR